MKIIIVLSLLQSVRALPVAATSQIVNITLNARSTEKFVWAALGDSWASGVSWHGAKTDYDHDKDSCHRWKESYSPLMASDSLWTINPQEFHFLACSGALLENIYKTPQGDAGKPQMDQLDGAKPQMMTYHAGGNNCFFGAVFTSCIYPTPQVIFEGGLPKVKYLPEYPDPAGICAENVKKALDYVNEPFNKEKSSLYRDELYTIQDMLTHVSVKDNQKFKLYILSYAHFFHLADNFCSTMSFAPLSGSSSNIGNAPKLSVRLRTDMNDAVSRVNDILRRVVAEVADPRVSYLDISGVFQGHRFCEDAHSNMVKRDQWLNPDVWLWNLVPPFIDKSVDPAKDLDRWLENGILLEDSGDTLNGLG